MISASLGSTALSYLLTVIQDDEADIVINLDEDAFVTDNAALSRLLDHVIEHGYVNCGMPDGGVVPIRGHHPLVTNPFFNILNTARIRREYRSDLVEGFPVAADDYLNDHPQALLKTEYSMDDYEPFNRLFVWLARTFPTLYLDALTHPDGLSTILCDHLGHPFLIHTWYTREYLWSTKQTRRIDNRICESAVFNALGSRPTRIEMGRHWAIAAKNTLSRFVTRALQSTRRRLRVLS